MKGTRCPSVIADLAAVVKQWEQQPPPVEQTRPSHCSGCKAPSRPFGQRLNVVGHGKRQRQVWGPLKPQGEPCLVLVWVQRFLCLLCKRSMTVWPPSVVPGRYYSASAILLALALWSVVGLSSLAVRQRVSPWKKQGTSVQSWERPRSWVQAVEGGRLFAGAIGGSERSGPARQRAVRIVLVLAGGPLSESPWERAHRAFNAGAVSA